jgi:hypothetical protein
MLCVDVFDFLAKSLENIVNINCRPKYSALKYCFNKNDNILIHRPKEPCAEQEKRYTICQQVC